MSEHAEVDPKKKAYIWEGAIYVNTDTNGNIKGLMRKYVDDNLICGHETFEHHSEKTLEFFDSGPRENDHINFELETWTSLNIQKLDQNKYIPKFEERPLNYSFTEFSYVRTKLSLVNHTRPGIFWAISVLSQVREKTFDEDDIKSINNVIKILIKAEYMVLLYPKNDESTLHLKLFSDAAFANYKELYSKIGYIALLCDKEQLHVLHYTNKNIKGVVRSVLAA